MDEPERLFERFCRAGDTEALGRVFDATAPRLLQIAVHLLGDLATSEDAVQATFVTAIQRTATFDTTRSLDSWLAGILANHARTLNKSARRRIDAADIPARIEPTPLERALEAEWSAALAEAIDRVPEPYRLVLIMRLQHGMEPIEIAHALQRSPGAVRVQLHRGRELLRKTLPAGIVASASFLAAPSRGLERVKTNVIEHAAFAKSGVGIAGIAGGLLMSTKWIVSGAAVILAFFAVVLARERATETAKADLSSGRTEKKEDGLEAARDEAGLGISNSPDPRAEVAPDSPPSQDKLVKLHGHVFDSDTNAGVVGAEVRLFPPQIASLSDIRRRWHDRLDVFPDGTVSAQGWPSFGAIPAGQSRADTEYGTSFTNEARLGLEALTSYAPPAPSEGPIARAITDASGDFEIVAPRTLGFLLCNAEGYSQRERAVAPAEVNKLDSASVTIRVAMSTAKRISGYVVDENLKRIERRVHLRFDGHVNKPAPVSVDNKHNVSGEIEADLQMDSWVVETNPDGSFDCRLPARMVYARSLEPELDFVKQGFLRDHGTRFVDEVWPEPGNVREPLVVVLQSVAALVVRDRDTLAPIEDIHLFCTRNSNGFPLRFGQFFAPGGRLRLARDDAVDSAINRRDEENSPCECTVWADGYLPSTQALHDLTSPGVIEFNLQRGELPTLTGRVHDGPLDLPSARISIAPLSRGPWQPPGGVPLAMSTANSRGEFRLSAPSGHYLLRVAAGENEDSRVVDLPGVSPIDVDFSIDTAILTSLHDSSGAPCPNHPVRLLALDGRRLDVTSDAGGTARFSRLSAGNYRVMIMDPVIAVGPKPDQEVMLDLQAGDQLRADFVVPLSTPRFARLVVEGSASLADWKARFDHAGEERTWTNVEPTGRIPIDMRGKRTLDIVGPDAREWTAVLPRDAPDGHEVRILLDGLTYEGTITSQANGTPLKGLRIHARPWNDSGATGIISTAVTDQSGRFTISGLLDEEYSISFLGDPSFEEDGVYVHTIAHPASPAAQLGIALPRRRGPMVGGYGGRGFDGMPDTVLTGTVHRSSTEPLQIHGFIGSVLSREGYTLILYTEFGIPPNGNYEVSIPVAPDYTASLRNASTGESLGEFKWSASGASDREIHDLDLP